jgi:hypothetical protein
MRQWMLAAAVAIAMAGVASAEQASKPTTTGPSKMGGSTGPAPDVPGGDVALGSVRIPRAVTADGKALKPGTYQVRLTAQEAKPDAPGATEKLERWVEFVQGGQVRGREVVSIIPGTEISQIADDSPPRAGGSKVQMLKGNDYIRVWINRGGTHYLIHLPAATT